MSYYRPWSYLELTFHSSEVITLRPTNLGRFERLMSGIPAAEPDSGSESSSRSIISMTPSAREDLFLTINGHKYEAAGNYPFPIPVSGAEPASRLRFLALILT